MALWSFAQIIMNCFPSGLTRFSESRPNVEHVILANGLWLTAG